MNKKNWLDSFLLRNLSPDSKDTDSLRNLYNTSFPDEERKSFEMILNGIRHGVMKGFFLEDPKTHKAVALAFSIINEKADILDYLAVDPEFQDQGIGSALLELLGEEKHPLIVEIESSRMGDPLTKKRKEFYLRNGFMDNNLEISLFGVDMELLSTYKPIEFEEYFEIFSDYMKPFIKDFPFNLNEKIILKS